MNYFVKIAKFVATTHNYNFWILKPKNIYMKAVLKTKKNYIKRHFRSQICTKTTKFG